LAVHTPPTDLPDAALRTALETGWSLDAAALAYRPVGFGSHHWELTDGTGVHWFVTVDDLRTRRLSPGEPLADGCTPHWRRPGRCGPPAARSWSPRYRRTTANP
jgi:hypothetical protein